MAKVSDNGQIDKISGPKQADYASDSDYLYSDFMSMDIREENNYSSPYKNMEYMDSITFSASDYMYNFKEYADGYWQVSDDDNCVVEVNLILRLSNAVDYYLHKNTDSFP